MPGMGEIPQTDEDRLPIENEDDADDLSDDIDDDDSDDADDDDLRDDVDDDAEDDDTDDDDGDDGFEDEQAYLVATFGEDAKGFDSVEDYVNHLKQSQKATTDTENLSEDRINELVEKAIAAKSGGGGGTSSGDDDFSIDGIDFESAIDDAVKSGKFKDYDEDQIRDFRSFSKVLEKPLKSKLAKVDQLLHALGNLAFNLDDRTKQLMDHTTTSAWSDFNEKYPGFNKSELDKIKKTHNIGSYHKAAKFAAIDDPVKSKLLSRKPSSNKGDEKKRNKNSMRFPRVKGGGGGKDVSVAEKAKKYLTPMGTVNDAALDKDYPPHKSGAVRRKRNKILDYIIKYQKTSGMGR